jgi:hypothetical protein
MELEFVRSPDSSIGYFAGRRFKGFLNLVRWTEEQWGIEMGFTTNPSGPNRSRFRAAIDPQQFEKLARIMMEADPQAAIVAFGAALRDAEVTRVQKPSSDSDRAVA